MAQLDQENIWKIVKETRKSLFSRHPDPDCENDDSNLAATYVTENIDHFAEKLKLNPSLIPKEKIM